jgi:hypothetical protein
MRWTRAELRWRDALLAALLPAPGPLPGAGDVDLEAFWPHFAAAAPAHLALGFRAAVTLEAAVLPWLLGYFRTLPALTPDERDAVLRRADALPVFRDLLEVAKVVGCLGLFADPAVQTTVRAPR